MKRDIEILKKQIQNSKGQKLKHGGKENLSVHINTKKYEESRVQPGGDLEVTIELFFHLTSPVFPGGLHALVVG